MTLQEYLTYDDGTDNRYELVDGVLVEMGAESTIFYRRNGDSPKETLRERFSDISPSQSNSRSSSECRSVIDDQSWLSTPQSLHESPPP
jgi:hypothetical protein